MGDLVAAGQPLGSGVAEVDGDAAAGEHRIRPGAQRRDLRGQLAG
jgi:hypothetical protein